MSASGNLRRMRRKSAAPAAAALPIGYDSSPRPHQGDENRPSRLQVERAQRVADQVYRSLRQAIILGDFAPGSRLREVEVAASLNVSRTPLREAISRLIGDHLVRPLPTGGVEVADATAELSEIYYIREALEACAARLAAMRITKEQLARLKQLLTATETTSYTDYEQRARINEQFHMLIAEASGSRRLTEMIGGLREFFVNARWLRRYDRRSAQQALQQHKQIVAALKAGAEERVERLVRDHLKSAYAKLLSDHSTPASAPKKKPISRRLEAQPTE